MTISTIAKKLNYVPGYQSIGNQSYAVMHNNIVSLGRLISIMFKA